MPTRRTRPPAQSFTSYESCNLCDRKEEPGMQKKTLDIDSDDSCIICEKKKTPRKGKTRVSPSMFMRGIAYSSKGGYTEQAPPKWIKESKPKKRSPTARKGTSGRSYASLDSCGLCEEEEVPRVAPPKWIKESKPTKRSSTRGTYAKKSSPSCQGCERGYGGTEIYEKRRKTSPKEYRKPEGETFRKWKEMEKRETCPLRMTGSISQRQPRTIRKEPRTGDYYQRFNSPYACPAEMMDDDDDEDMDDDEEMFDDIPPCIENRINKIKKRMSETCLTRETGKGRPKRLSASSSQKRDIQVPMEPKYKECLGRYQDQCVYSGEVMNDLQDMSSEEFIPHVESSTQMVKKTVSRTSFQKQKKKISPKQINGARKGSKHKDCFKNHGVEDSRGIKSVKEYKKKDVDEFSDDTDEIDFEEHKNHPKDHGKSFKDGYEKYVNKNGSEIWVKTEEKYSELHHIP